MELSITRTHGIFTVFQPSEASLDVLRDSCGMHVTHEHACLAQALLYTVECILSQRIPDAMKALGKPSDIISKTGSVVIFVPYDMTFVSQTMPILSFYTEASNVALRLHEQSATTEPLSTQAAARYVSEYQRAVINILSEVTLVPVVSPQDIVTYMCSLHMRTPQTPPAVFCVAAIEKLLPGITTEKTTHALAGDVAEASAATFAKLLGIMAHRANFVSAALGNPCRVVFALSSTEKDAILSAESKEITRSTFTANLARYGFSVVQQK